MPNNPPETEAKKAPAEKAETPPPAASAPPPAAKEAKWKPYALYGGIGLVVVAGVFIALHFINRGLPEGLIQANGRIEGDSVSVASKFPGRIAKLLVREGDSVTSGQVLAVL